MKKRKKKRKYEVLCLIGRYRGWIPAISIPEKGIKSRTRQGCGKAKIIRRSRRHLKSSKDMLSERNGQIICVDKASKK